MNLTWRNFLSRSGARFAAETDDLLDFGQPEAELQTAATGTVIVPLTHLALLTAEGDDTKSFLHGQFTSDINHLADGQAQHAAWCSAKGRMQASFVVWPVNSVYHLILAADLQAAIQKRLQMFILRAKVKLSNLTESHVLLGLSGKQAAQSLAAANLPCPASPMSTASAGQISVMQLDSQRYLLALPAEAAETVWAALTQTARPTGLPAWRYLDVQAAFPLVSAATKEEFVPQMADFEKIGGVSFHKGCYPGQEIVARTQYLGKVKRHLYRVNCAEALNVGDDLYSPDHPDQAAGKIMTAAPGTNGDHVGLAVIQANYAGNLHLKNLSGTALTATAVNP